MAFRFHVGCFAIACLFAGAALSEDQPNADEQIQRLQKELAQVQSERQKNRAEIDKEQRDFNAYRERNAKRVAQVMRDADSLKNLVSRQNKKSDSLAAQIGWAHSRSKQAELSRDNLRQILVASCDSAEAEARRLPPLLAGQARTSIALVKSEIAAKSIDNTEAFSRLSQIWSIMQDATSSIQVSQESSPVPDIRGVVYRIRVGGFFEAVVDVKGEKAATWDGWSADGAPRWSMVSDKGVTEQVLRAATMREGKTLPGFVKLPLAAKKGGAL